MKSFRNTALFIILLISAWIARAQETEEVPMQQQAVDPKVREKVEAARIALITNRLGLTPDQAEKFWPIYREFSMKRMEMRQEYRQMQQTIDPNNPDPKKQQELVNFGFQLKQKELDLEKDYSGRIMHVITAQQMLSLRKAEQDFRQMILNQLQQRRALQQRKENFRDKNQRLRLNKK
jgi:hypothetical protein